MDRFKIEHNCGDGAFCGSFSECGKCNNCPVHIDWNVTCYCETETDVFYASFYMWPALDYDVCTVDPT